MTGAGLEPRRVLLDPVVPEDVALIDVDDHGYIVASQFAVGSAKSRVDRLCELYGLNLPRVRAARQRVIREVRGRVTALLMDVEAAKREGVDNDVADSMSIRVLMKLILDKTKTSSPYSRTARAALLRLGVPELCASPEEDPEEAADAA